MRAGELATGRSRAPGWRYSGTQTSVCALVVLEVAGGGELLAAALLRAYEGLLAVVRAHVHLQPLQHVKALAAALGAAAERPVISAGGSAQGCQTAWRPALSLQGSLIMQYYSPRTHYGAMTTFAKFTDV